MSFSERLKQRIGNLAPHGRALSVSALNQGVSSGLNFAIGLYLVRNLTPTQFGEYGLGFAFVLLFGGLCNSLFTTQMVVKLPSIERSNWGAYIATMLTTLCVTSVCTLIILGIVAGVAIEFSQSNLDMRVVLASLLSSAGYALKDFFVRLAYSFRKEHTALAINGCIAVTVCIGFLILYISKSEITSASALLVFGLGQFAGVIVGSRFMKINLRSSFNGEIFRNIVLSWRGGQWSFGGAIIIWLQSQAYIMISAMMIGTVGVGVANAGRLFVSPFMFLSPAIGQVLLPRLASQRINGALAVSRSGANYSKWMSILSAIYIAITVLLFDYVRPLLLGGHYLDIRAVAFAWFGVLFFQLIREGASLSLQALGDFKGIFVRNTFTAAFACLAAIVLAYLFGPVGAVSSIVAAEAMLAVLLWTRLKSMQNTSDEICGSNA